MKKLLSLLSVLTISGTAVPTTIAASPYQKEKNNLEKSEINLQTNNSEKNNYSLWDFIFAIGKIITEKGEEFKNYLENILENKVEKDELNNINIQTFKFFDDNKVLTVSFEDNNYNIHNEVNGYWLPKFTYFYGLRTIDLTKETGITDWYEFKNKYKYVTFNNGSVEFNRHDKYGGEIWRNNLLNKIDINKTKYFKNADISKLDNKTNITIATGSGSTSTFPVAGSIEWPFLHQQNNWKIFDNSIKHGWSVTQAKVNVGLQSYIQKPNKHLMLRICEQTELYSGGTTIGSTVNVFLGTNATFYY